MNELKKKRIVDDILGRPQRAGKEHLYFCKNCNHHKPKLSINYEKNVAKCWTCNWATPNLRRLVRRWGNFLHVRQWKEFDADVELGELEQIFSSKEEEAQRIDLPSEFHTLTGNTDKIIYKKAFNYLKKRGISKEDIVAWKIGFCASGEYKDRIIVPSFNAEGHCDFFVGRSYTDDWRKYLAPSVNKDIVFNDLFVDWDKPVHLVEGVFDAIKAGTNSIPLLGSSLRENSKLFQKLATYDTPLYVALDADAEKKAMSLIHSLLQYDCEVYRVNLQGFDDVGEMSREEYQERVKTAKRFNPETYLIERALMA